MGYRKILEMRASILPTSRPSLPLTKSFPHPLTETRPGRRAAEGWRG